MWRPFLTVPKQITITTTADNVRVGRSGLHVPVAVFDRVFDELHILDRCCLALCNKALLKHAVSNEHLHYLLSSPPSRRDVQNFFERRLGLGWLRRGLRYCPYCGLFESTLTVKWRLISEKLTRERSGAIADLWRKRRDDGWLRYWIERWCDDTPYEIDSAASAIRTADQTRLMCPRCAILDPESNTWRRQISGSTSEG